MRRKIPQMDVPAGKPCAVKKFRTGTDKNAKGAEM